MKLKKELIYKAIPTDNNNWDENIKNADLNEKRLKELDAIAEKEHTILGASFATPVADGKAIYQVQEINRMKNQCKVVRCSGICLDEYQDNYIGEEAWIDLIWTTQRIVQQRALNQIF